MVRHRSILAALSLAIGTGCHAGRPPRVPNADTPISRPDVVATQFVEQHNRNASSVRSLTAHPRINTVGDSGRQRFVGRANGNLALDGDKNFRLEIATVIKPVADIGSNDEGFWFWADDDPTKAIYVCDYKDIDSCQLGVSMQPDWIMEAMGLRRFTEAEAKTMHSRQGPTPDTFLLTQSRKDAKQQTLVKETLVDQSTLRIKEHRLYAHTGSKKELLASAVVSQYKPYKLASDPAAPADQPAGTALIPDKLRLTWVMEKEKFTLDITMSDVRVNPNFKPAARAELFSEPKIAGTTRQDLALLDPATTPASRVYESRPIPSSGGIGLGAPEPSPIGSERATRRQIDPAPLTPDLSATPAQPAGVVGAMVPRGRYYGR